MAAVVNTSAREMNFDSTIISNFTAHSESIYVTDPMEQGKDKVVPVLN
jgi:hypothetical protein